MEIDMDKNMTCEQKAQAALEHLRNAREYLHAAGARRTLAKLRAIMDSAEGAVRAARYRDMRLAREVEAIYSAAPPSPHDELIARPLGYYVVMFHDDPGKFYWKTKCAVAFHGEDTVEGAWRAACVDAEIEAEG